LLLLVTLSLLGQAWANEPKAERLARLLPLEPAAAARSFRTWDGFRMDLLAHEPLITSPVAVAYDEGGKAYVLEMRDYPYTDKGNDKPFAESTRDLPLGRIRILSSSKGDGVYDQSVIFADNLSWPTGLVCWKGGVFVAATPDLWYLKDTDGDGKADVRQKVFTGFRKFNIQAVINNLQWGLDHRVYAAGGTNGGTIRSLLEPKAPVVALGANDFRFDPRQPLIEPLPGGARFGQSFDDRGNRFICNIRNPVIHAVLPGPYLARNPFVPIRSALHNASPTGDTLPVYRISPSEPWRALRAGRWAAAGENMPRSELVADGYFTSACGITIYRGAAYPKRYLGNAFVAEPAGNLVHREAVTPDGVTFSARRADDKCEFVASTDTWFRPVNFVNAPDGTLHVVDMYREFIEHPWSIPDDIKAQLDLESGRDRGRLWRLSPPGFRAPAPPRLGRAGIAELVACLENPNSWWRETAHRLLFERQDGAAVAPLRQLLRSSKSPLARLHALWSLHGLESLDDDDLLTALKDQDAGVREHGVRLSEPRTGKSTAFPDRVLELARDAAMRVRFQVAFTLGTIEGEKVVAALGAIARKDGQDEWARAAILSSAPDRCGRLLEELGEDRASPALRHLVRQCAEAVGNRQDRLEISGVMALLSDGGDGARSRPWQTEVLLGLAAGTRRRGQTLNSLFQDSEGKSNALLRQFLTEAATMAADERAEPSRREQAAELLGLGDMNDARGPLIGLLDPRQPASLQLAAIRVLSGFNNSEVPELLLAGWSRYSPAVRAEVVQALLARPQRVSAVLDAIEKKQLTAADVPSARRALLLRHQDPKIRARATTLLSAEAGSRKEALARYQEALNMLADHTRGRLVFQRICANCHRLEGEGHAVGPDLEAVRHQAPEQILTSILDPNREVSPNYLEYLVTTRDGRTTSGVIVAETVTGVTLRRAGGAEETVLRRDIEELAGTNRSLMPEGLEQSVNMQEMADLLAFLLGKGRKAK
jgi:putative membrane-bound dehydrogenase-like protein